MTLGIIVGVLFVAVVATVVYILRTGAKPTQNAAVLYAKWQEPFDLEPLTDGKKSGERNAKVLAKNMKLLWDKKELEEIDLKHDIEGLTQEHALEYVSDANGLFLEKTTKGFVYDIRDARDGTLRLFSLEKDSNAYKNFIFGQAVIKLLREKTSLAEFPDIDFPEGTEQAGLANLRSFVIAQAGINTDPEALYEITATLSEKFGDEWDVFLVADDVLKFAKAEPEEEPIVEELNLDPFAQQKEAKRLAEEQAEKEREQLELDRRLRWEQAEKAKREAELAARQAAIEAGEISPLTLTPLVFLSQAIEIAADDAGILSLDDEADIKRSDRIGGPTLFSVYSDELIDTEGEPYRKFTEDLVKALEGNFGGEWSFEPDAAQASSISFSKVIA